MTTPSLPALPADLDWLIHMEPTQDALDDYLAGRPPAWAAPGAHNSPFSVSNVFASPATAPIEQRVFDLIPNGLLADEPDHRFRPYACQYNHGADEALGAMRQNGVTWSTTDYLPPSYKEIKAREKRVHETPIHTLCRALLVQWENALGVYDHKDHKCGKSAEHGYRGAEHCGARPRLYLTKPNSFTPTDKPSRPDMTLLKDLGEQGAAAHLFLLTARHELGNMYELVKKAYADANIPRLASYTPPDGWGLDQWYVDLLGARARGYTERHSGVPSYSTDFNDTTPVRRTDTRIRLFVPYSSLAEIYYCFEWWYDKAHGIATNRIRCELAGCQAFVPPGRTTYCCKEHAADGRRAKDAKHKQEKRHRGAGCQGKAGRGG